MSNQQKAVLHTNPQWTTKARELDAADPLRWLPDHFYQPPGQVYLDGNSLGLMSREARAAVEAALDTWGRLGVSAWTAADPAWFTWTEEISDRIGTFLGANPGEITLGTSTTVMLHQLLATLYRPYGPRRKILLDCQAFPTDRYAAASFVQQRGLSDALVVVSERSNRLIHSDDILAAADETVALAVLPSVVFTTGQALPMREITDALRAKDIMVIWDLSHSAGLFPHTLHHDIDAAVFCTYKYLNGGPGSPGGAFVHSRHWPLTPGLLGWWGSDNDRQFHMGEVFEGAQTSHALQLGTPSILSLAALAGSADLTAQAGIDAIYERSRQLLRFFEEAVTETAVPLGVRIVTPAEPQRGGHLSLSHPQGAAVAGALRAHGIIPDFRHPDMIRLSPAPQTTRFIDIARAVQELESILQEELWRQFVGVQSPVT